MQSAALFREFCSTNGLENTDFNAQQTLTLCFDGLHNITACLHPEDKAVLLYAVVGSAAPLSREGVALRLLQCSLLGADTGGGALGLYEPAQAVMLWKRHDDNFVSVDVLRQALERFLAELVRWKQIWADGILTGGQNATASSLPSESAEQPDSPVTAASQPPPLASAETNPTTTTENLTQFGLRV